MYTLRCLINGEVKINGRSKTFVKFNKRGVKINRRVGISKNPLILVINEKREFGKKSKN